MLQVQTKVKIIDNSGALKARCINIYEGKSSGTGSIILVSIQKVQTKLVKKVKILKGEIYKALTVRTCFKRSSKFQEYVSFDVNAVILLNKQGLPLGSRILGPVPFQLRTIKKMKILTMCSNIV
jgi:large subunit ribosomal protein L14